MRILFLDYLDLYSVGSDCLTVLHEFMELGNIVFVHRYLGHHYGSIDDSDTKVLSFKTLLGNDYEMIDNFYVTTPSGSISKINFRKTDDERTYLDLKNTGYAINELIPSEIAAVFLNSLFDIGKVIDLGNVIALSKNKEVINSIESLGGTTYLVNPNSGYAKAPHQGCPQRIEQMIVSLKKELLSSTVETDKKLTKRLVISDKIDINYQYPDVMFADINGTLCRESIGRKDIEMHDIIMNYLSYGNVLAMVTKDHGGILTAFEMMHKFLYDVPQNLYNQIYLFSVSSPCIIYGDTFYDLETDYSYLKENEEFSMISTNKTRNIPISFSSKKDVVLPFLSFLIRKDCQPQKLYAVGDSYTADLSMLLEIKQLGGSVGYITCNRTISSLVEKVGNGLLTTREKNKIIQGLYTLKDDLYIDFPEYAKCYSLGKNN